MLTSQTITSDPTFSSSSCRRVPPPTWGSFTPFLMTLAGMAGPLSRPTARPTSRYLTRPILPRPTGRALNSPRMCCSESGGQFVLVSGLAQIFLSQLKPFIWKPKLTYKPLSQHTMSSLREMRNIFSVENIKPCPCPDDYCDIALFCVEGPRYVTQCTVLTKCHDCSAGLL